MAQIELRNIVKHYGTAKKPEPLILKGLNVEIQAGEFVVVVGPSGCGKSTFLRTIAGLEPVTGGQIFIDEMDVTDLEPSKRNISMVFQNYALYPHMTVRENMAYGVKLAKMPKVEIDRRVLETAKMLDIEAHLNKKPNALSGGQRQRVAMGRAIVRQPKLFLFDEPLSNLDAKLRTSTRLEIRKRHNKIGITTLYVTHDQTEAMTLADRIIILNAGEIEQFATPYEIFHQPASTFVASFMGAPAMNLLPIEINSNGVVYFKNIPLQGVIPPDYILQQSQRYWILGIRPEHINIMMSDSVEGVTLSSQLLMVETLGSEQLLYCEVERESIIVKITDIGEVDGQHSLQSVNLSFDLNRLHWFDIETQRRAV